MFSLSISLGPSINVTCPQSHLDMSRGPLLHIREVRMPRAGEVQVPVPTIEKSRMAAGMRNMWGRKEHVFTSWRRHDDPYGVICFTWRQSSPYAHNNSLQIIFQRLLAGYIGPVASYVFLPPSFSFIPPPRPLPTSSSPPHLSFVLVRIFPCYLACLELVLFWRQCT